MNNNVYRKEYRSVHYSWELYSRLSTFQATIGIAIMVVCISVRQKTFSIIKFLNTVQMTNEVIEICTLILSSSLFM